MTRLATLAALMLSLAACETIEGFGEDVQAGGQAIESSAEQASY